MLIVRPVNFGDIQALEQLAVVAGGSVTTLPANRDHLSELIGATQSALRKEVRSPGGETYHFVLQESDSGAVVGVAGIDSAVGLKTPFYSYRIDQVVHASSDLQIHNRIPALNLCQDHTGSTSLCSLFLAPAYRTPDNLNLLSRARLLFIAEHRQRFADRMLAELQGVVDSAGKSPFWESLGRHFFSMEFSRANYLTGIQSKGFIADLMPHYPVYVPLLPPAAQEVIGAARPDVDPIRELLIAEGLEYRGYVDIFDAGPTLETRTDQVRTLRDSRLLALGCGEKPAAATYLVANRQGEQFRCLLTQLDDSHPTLSPAESECLGLGDGDEARVHSLTP